MRGWSSAGSQAKFALKSDKRTRCRSCATSSLSRAPLLAVKRWEWLAGRYHFWPRPLLAQTTFWLFPVCAKVERRIVGPRRVGAQIFALFFFPLLPHFSFFLPSLGGLLVEFWWCLKRQDPEMCTFGVLGLSCETLAPPFGAPRFVTPFFWVRGGNGKKARNFGRFGGGGPAEGRSGVGWSGAGWSRGIQTNNNHNNHNHNNTNTARNGQTQKKCGPEGWGPEGWRVGLPLPGFGVWV